MMPYIPNQMQRKRLDYIVELILDAVKKDDTICFGGNINYLLFKLAKTCKNYRDYRDFIGELEAAKLEIYRRQVAPYEDKKIKSNGDVE